VAQDNVRTLTGGRRCNRTVTAGDHITCGIASRAVPSRGHASCRKGLIKPRSFVHTNKGGDAQACAGCANSERREFVQRAVGAVAALVGLSLLDASPAVAGITALSAPSAGARGEVKYAIPAADGISIDGSNDVIIARAAGNAYAFALSCPHQNTALRWNNKDHRFQCPKHKSRYTATGEFIDGRATRNMDRLPIRLDGTALLVDTAREIRSDEEPAKWTAATVKLS
jgi:nitrite reductase/ring-hydroxylating ferredoxin subunit